MLSFYHMPIYLLPPVLLCLRGPSLAAEKKFVPWLLLKFISLPGQRKTYIREYHCQNMLLGSSQALSNVLVGTVLGTMGKRKSLLFRNSFSQEEEKLFHFHFLGQENT